MDADDREVDHEVSDATETFLAIALFVVIFTLACLISWPR